MKVIIFGATGMVGQGVLRECLKDARVEQVLCVGRSSTAQQHPKLVDLVQADLYDVESMRSRLQGYDACYFCLGISSFRMSEDAYRHLTYDLTMAIAPVLAQSNPAMTFVYVSGAGTDSTERGRSMWARVKGATENALLKLPFKAAYMFRPGAIVPQDGIKSKTQLYRVAYTVMRPLFSLIRLVSPGSVTTTEQVGRAMLKVTRDGAPKAILESVDISRLASS